MAVDVEVRSDWRPIYRAITSAFWASVEDMKNAAVGRASVRSGRLRGSAWIERRGLRAARVRFDTPYAKAREKGAYIQARNRPRLAFTVKGRFVQPRAVRQQARPYLWPAGRAWKSTFFPNRLRQAGRR